MRNKHLLFAALTAIFLPGISLTYSQAQALTKRPIAMQVTNLKKSGVAFKPASLFSINTARSIEMPKTIKGAVPVTLDLTALSAIQKANNDAIAFSFPYDDKDITLELYRVNIFSDDFTVVTDQSNGAAVPYTPGVYYRGIVKGDTNSVAAFSFFDGEMMGIVSTNNYLNINVGKSEKEGAKSNEYIIYSEHDLPNFQNTGCSTPDNPAYSERMSEFATNGATLRTQNCVKIYYEVDNNIYVSSGSTINGATNWMTAVHNNVATLYSNDQITIALSQIYVWTTADGYNGTTSFDQLAKFKENRPTFNGDLGLLVGVDAGALGGVASAVNGMCSATDKYCYADASYSYSTAPVYSWTVMLCTHELGHLMGSAHTQNCSWPGGPIDNCYATEGGCPAGPAPVDGGTLMSYCYLTSYGINFNRGFGSLPAAAIQGAIDAAECLSLPAIDTCGLPNGLGAASVTSSSATLSWFSAFSFNSFNVQYRETGTTSWTSMLTTINSLAISGLSANTQYEFQVQNICPSAMSNFSSSFNFSTIAPVCVDNYEPNNLKTTTSTLPVNTTITALISSYADIDWFNFSNTSSQKNIKITLSNLPANYNLQLYEPSGALKVSSKKANTLNEEIILNNYTVGKYKLKVFGANSAFNASQCYSLSATISSTPFRLEEEEETAVVASMNIFPNPTMGDLTVIYNSNSNALVDIYVVDVTGKVMLMQTNDALKGSNTYHFDLNRLNNGVYFLQIRNGNEISHTKLMIGR